MEERRYEVRIETRFEAIRGPDCFYGVGVLRNLSRSGAWVDDANFQPPMGGRVRIALSEVGAKPVLLDGDVVRRTSSGFAVELDPATFSVVGLLLDRLAAAGPHGLGEAR